MVHKKGPRGLRAYIITPRRQIKEFLATITLQQLGAGLINIFEPVYLYDVGVSPVNIMVYFLAVYVPYLFLLPLGGRFAKRFGYEHALAVGTFFNVAYFAALAAIPYFPEALYVAPLMLCLQKTFWWPAYHANFARFSRTGEVAREVGTVQGLYNVASAAAPVVGGFVAQYTGFGTLFAVAIGVLVISVVPLFTTKEKFVPTDITWREQWVFLLRRRYRRRLLGSLGFGSEFVNMVPWPLFVFLVLGTTSQLGIVAGISTVAMTVATLLIGRWLDRAQRQRQAIMNWITTIHALSWLVRPWARGFTPVALAGSFGSAALNVTYVPYYQAVYNDAKANHVMIEVVAAEMALVLGKILTMLVLVGVLGLTGSLPATFFVGFTASLFFFFFR